MPYEFRGGQPPRQRKRARFGQDQVNPNLGPKQSKLGAQKPVRPGAPTNKPANKPKPQAKPKGGGFQPDSLYNEDIGSINAQETDRLNTIAGEKQNVEHEFGVVDPTNPFSRMEALKRTFLARRKGASVGLASQGQLYSGAHERALSRTRLEEEQARNELYNAYQSAIQGLGTQERETKYATEEQRRQAFEEWLDRAPEADAGSEPVAPPAPAVAPATGGNKLVDKGKGMIGGEQGKDEPQAIAFGGRGRKGKGKNKRRNASYSKKRTSGGNQKSRLGGKPAKKPKPRAK